MYTTYNIQAHIAFTREKGNYQSDSNTRKWVRYSIAVIAHNKNKSGKISWFITELIYTVKGLKLLQKRGIIVKIKRNIDEAIL